MKIVPVLRAVAEEAGFGFGIVGSADRAFELTVVEVYFTFWQT